LEDGTAESFFRFDGDEVAARMEKLIAEKQRRG